jgi:mannan endo-1,4-beta-mannosidase
MLAVVSSGSTDSVGFHLDGRQLVEADGTPFLARGTHYPHGYMAIYDLEELIIGQVAQAGCNCIRIQLSAGTAAGGFYDPPNDSEIADLIELCKANKLIAILANVDTTSHSATFSLDDAADWWIANKAAVMGQEHYMLLNIANEPFDDAHAADWETETIAAVVKLRNAGFRHCLVIDMPNNAAQDWTLTGYNAAATVLTADPLGNLIFSVHMYTVYSSATPITTYIDAFVTDGLPLMVGEFGNDSPDTTVDNVNIMAECEANDIGYVAFCWIGDDTPGSGFDEWNFSGSYLTAQGVQIFNDPNGIRSTREIATVFGDTTPKAATLVDNFATQDDMKWVRFGGATISGSRFSVVPTVAYPALYAARKDYDLTASYALIECVQAPNVGTGTIGATMSVGPAPHGSGHLFQFGFYGGNFVVTYNGGSGSTFSTLFSETWNATNHRWWRMREAGGTAFWETSNGTTWTTKHSLAVSGLTDVQISVSAGFWGTEPSPGTAIFDNFNNY